jgi:hypothetical protein
LGRQFNVKRYATIAIIGPACFAATVWVGYAFHFDGQAAVLTLPLVLAGWLSIAFTIILSLSQIIRFRRDRRAWIATIITWVSYTGILLLLVASVNNANHRLR